MEFPIELPPKHAAMAASLNIFPEDIEEHFTRASGPGGQKVNKTESCVELLHKPTGVKVKVQKHREQRSNRTSAYKLLILKIEEHVKGAKSEIQKEIFKKRKQKQRRTRRSKEKMLEEKHHRGDVKETRKKII